MHDAGPLDIHRLVADHHEAVYRYAYRLCGSAADAEDLTQQVFLLAHTRLDQLREPGHARGWLFAILRTAFLKSVRRQPPEVSLDADGALEALSVWPAETAPIDSEQLQKALDELPAEFKLVLLMFYFEDYSYREIAERLELPIGTVMSRLSRAKGHLRARLFEPQPQG